MDQDGNEYDPEEEFHIKKDMTMTAKYEGGHADIVINREDLKPGESATYTVSKLCEGGTKTYLLTAVLTNTTIGGTASRRLINLEPGNYLVEETSWNWAYDKIAPQQNLRFGETGNYEFVFEMNHLNGAQVPQHDERQPVKPSGN